MDLSFAILTWNSAAYVERCLMSIERALSRSPLSYEILVLDNGSQDDTPRILERLGISLGDRLRVRCVSHNMGTTKSRNLLLRESRGRYLCVLDSDVELPAGVIETLVPYLADEKIGVVVPRILYPSGNWQKSFDRFPTVFDKVNRFFRLREIERRESVDAASSPFHVDYAIAAFWLMRRELLLDVGLLDEKIFYAPEDVDFCLRVWKAGRRILYVPAVFVVHHAQEISRGFRINAAKIQHLKGLCYYFLKHRYCLRRPIFTPPTFVGGGSKSDACAG